MTTGDSGCDMPEISVRLPGDAVSDLLDPRLRGTAGRYGAAKPRPS